MVAVGGMDHIFVVNLIADPPSVQGVGNFGHGSVSVPRFDRSGRRIFFYSVLGYELNVETSNYKEIAGGLLPRGASEQVIMLRYVATSDDGQYRIADEGLVDIVNNELLFSIVSSDLSVSADFKYICAPYDIGGDLQIQLFKMDSGKVELVSRKRVDGFGQILGSAIGGEPPVIVYFDGRARPFLLRGENLEPESLRSSVLNPESGVVTADGKTIVLLGRDGVESIDSTTRESISTIETRMVRMGAASDDSRRLAVIDVYDELSVYTLPELRLVAP